MTTITLREITKETVNSILALKVGDLQRNLVATNARSIAQAHFEPKSWFRAIYADDEPVGFMMTFENPDEGGYYLWRYMIDEKHQKKGYGRQALELLIERIKGMPNAKELYLSVQPGEGSAIPFYEKLGFEDTGEIEWGEHRYKLVL